MNEERDNATRAADLRVAALVGGRHGVATARELATAGISKDAIDVRVAAGRYQRLFRATYFVGSGPVPPMSWWLAGVLAAGPDAALAGLSAAGLWRMLPILVIPVHVVVPLPANRRSRPKLVVHRSGTLTTSDVTVRNGIPVTSPHRTILDLPRHLRDRALNQALVDGLLTRPPASMQAKPVTRSRLERRFLALVRRHHLPLPLCNVTIEGRERDFAWPERGLVVEIDGPHHDHEPQRRLDRARDRELTMAGYRVLRFAFDELNEHAAAHVAAALAVPRSSSYGRGR